MLARLLAIALLASASAPAHAAPLQPTGKWVVNFDEHQCIAERDYGTPAAPLKLIVKQPPLGSVVQVAVQGGGLFYADPDQVDGTIGFDTQAPVKIPAVEWRPKGSKLAFRMINVPMHIFAAARTARSMRFTAGPLRREFALSDIPDLLKVMDTCVVDLRRVWNVPVPAAGGAIQLLNGRPAQSPNLASLFSTNDYPGVAIYEDQSGSVTMVLLINEQGRVADCSLVKTSGVAVLDAQSCAIVRERARFKPAIGPDGKPRKDATLTTVTWRLVG